MFVSTTHQSYGCMRTYLIWPTSVMPKDNLNKIFKIEFWSSICIILFQVILVIITMDKDIQWNHIVYVWHTICFWTMDCIEKWKFMWVVTVAVYSVGAHRKHFFCISSSCGLGWNFYVTSFGTEFFIVI